ncbi:hypothetical protein [Verrucomicrobium sp. BvORR106]|uniref:hypothetical protein n=1 Tax=Verrucomicrobium sp. BvORR106 TaxID=1403819 RepID=UPI002240F95B|nr:hypothetical protein [Verrucomicrobium sp. BvORR106]
MAHDHGLHVRVESPQDAHRVVALSGISSAHACYEVFLLEFSSELRELRSIDVDFGRLPDGVAKHDHFATCLRNAQLLSKSPEFAVLDLLVELVRLTRNEQAHKGRALPKRFSEILTRLANCSNWDTVFEGRCRPSPFADLGYDDFLLFTHAVRRMAEFWCKLLLPSPQDIALHSDIRAFIAEQGSQKLPQFLRDRFALDPSSAEDVCSRL